MRSDIVLRQGQVCVQPPQGVIARAGLPLKYVVGVAVADRPHPAGALVRFECGTSVRPLLEPHDEVEPCLIDLTKH